MRVWALVAVVSVIAAAGTTSAVRQAETRVCPTAATCRAATLDAITAGDFERAHDLAWRVAQLSPRHDPAAMALLARAQSLSGRADDAFVMLRRLAEAGMALPDAETSPDFARVRSHPDWPHLQARLSSLDAVDDAVPSAASVPSATAGSKTARAVRKTLTPAAATASDLTDMPIAPTATAAPDSMAPVTSPRDTSGAAVPLPARKPSAPVLTLPLPPSITSPTAMAYDAVSARFVLADASSDALKIVSEMSGTATNLVSIGWAGSARTTAVAIDPRRGDLWVAGTDGDRGTLTRLQLISGRRLQTVEIPEELRPARFEALTIGPDDLYVLDTAGGRILRLGFKTAALRVYAPLPAGLEATGLAHAGSALYVAHAAGVRRIELATAAQRAVAVPAGLDVTHLHSLAWHEGALIGVQKSGNRQAAVRVRLNPRGGAVTSVDTIEAAGTVAGHLARGIYYYLVERPDGSGVEFRGVRAGQ